MNKVISLIAILSLTLSLQSCSTLKSKAEDHLENKNYHQARFLLIKALKRDKEEKIL
jgi:cobalamin biosynthesis protein CobD/CbiB